MGRKGWAGSPPADDTEARKRIVEATRAIVEVRGAAQTTLAEVAESLGVTRRTIYRYFAHTEDLFAAVAELTLEGYFAQVSAMTADLDITAQLVEVVAHIVERLPNEPLLELLLANDRSNIFSRNMLAPEIIERCRSVLQHTHIDWAALRYDDRTLDELVEFLLRNIQSLVIAPADPQRTPAQLRAYLRRWIAPALDAT